MLLNWRFWIVALTGGIVVKWFGLGLLPYTLGLCLITGLELTSWLFRYRAYGALVLRLSRPIGPAWLRWCELGCVAALVLLIIAWRLGWAGLTPRSVLVYSAGYLIVLLRLRLHRRPAELLEQGLQAGGDFYFWPSSRASAHWANVKSYVWTDGEVEITARGFAKSKEQFRLPVAPEEREPLERELDRFTQPFQGHTP